jgi:hypothetical protein
MNDSDLIDALGGPARMAERLNLKPEKGRVQRVHNWRTRGIPARIKLDHAALFAEMAARPRQPSAQETKDVA